MSKFAFRLAAALAVVLTGACGDDEAKGPLFTPKPECMGEAVVPDMGNFQLLLNEIAISEREEDGFDLDGDMMPDNAVAGLGGIANTEIRTSLDDLKILVPMEFFDYPTNAAPDDCVKLGFYLGEYALDTDGDGAKTATGGKDCNDTDMSIAPGKPEVAANLKDDDCDGLTDETPGDPADTPTTNAVDKDGDGVSPAQGDCDDDNATVHPGATEVCGNGLDEDCNKIADEQVDAQLKPVCSPYDATPDVILLDPRGFDDQGAPLIEFNAGETLLSGSDVMLRSGPSRFALTIPLFDDITIQLAITGATLEGTLVDMGDSVALVDGRLGGVLDAQSLDGIRGLDVPMIGLNPENSLLDASTGFLAPLLGLTAKDEDRCVQPDIDVDGDGLEIFCDRDANDTVETCIDGDGTVYSDENGIDCTAAKKGDKFLFVDGVSVLLKLSAVPAELQDKP